MTFKLTTYKTLTGEKQILETKSQKSTEAVIYENNQPAYLVDCFDLQTESNVQMNYLVLCQQRSMKNVIEEIGEKKSPPSLPGWRLFIKSPAVQQTEIYQMVQK